MPLSALIKQLRARGRGAIGDILLLALPFMLLLAAIAIDIGYFQPGEMLSQSQAVSEIAPAAGTMK